MKKSLHLLSAKAVAFFASFIFLFAFANAQVVNTSHPANSPYATIQAAIDDAITLNGDIIVVAGGTYNESINITKSIILRGAQADNCAGSREGTESIINCIDGIGINASNVTINGFTIQNQTSQNAPGFGVAINIVPPNTGTQLLNNIIRNNMVGSTLTNAGTSPAQVKIECNWFDNNNQPSVPANTLATGFSILSNEVIGGGIISNVLIDGNKFTGHASPAIDFLITTPTSAMTGLTISNNEFDGNLRAFSFRNVVNSSFSGNLVHNSTFTSSGDVRPFGGVNNLLVKNNSFIAGAGNILAVRISNTEFGGSPANSNITLLENSFVGYSPAVPAVRIISGYTGALNATCNWWNSTLYSGILPQVIGAVNFAPWLLSGTDNSTDIGFQPVPNSCSGGIPKLSTSINNVVVNTNNDGNDDLGSFAVCPTTNNILFNSFTDQNGLTNPQLKVYQTYTATNVTVPFCNNCSTTMAAFSGATGTAALINPVLPGILVMRFRSWVDTDNNGIINGSELASDWIQYTITVNQAPDCLITGTSSTCPNSGETFTGPAGMAGYSWSIAGAGFIDSIINNPTIEVFSDITCNGSYTVSLTVTDENGCTSTCSKIVSVIDTTGPTLTVPANVTLQCTDPIPLKPLEINSSPNFIDGTYNVGTAVFGAPLTATPLTADAVMVIDNGGNPYDACDSIINDLTGKIAVIERSGCTPPTSYFVNKAYKAQLAGAVGVIFIFNQPGDFVVTMGLPPGPNPTITIPLMLVSKNYGTTLKAEILAGPVNVSLSAPTVFANDVCSFAAITHQQTFTPGNCPSNYTIVNTWTATDRCGNATTKTQTITGIDNTAPTLTVPANVTLQCTDPQQLKPLEINSSPNFIDGTYNIGTAVFGAPLTATPLTADAILVNDGLGGAGNPNDACESIINDLTGKIAVIERSGCTPPTSYFVNKAYKAQLAGAVGVIFIFNQPGDFVVTMGLPPGPNPTITIPLMLVSKNYGIALKAEILAGPVNVSLSAPTVIANDVCSFVAITHQQTFTPGNCPSNYTIVNTWTATDRCGNATTKTQTIIGLDNTPPTLTVPANVTLQCTDDPLPGKPLEINSSPNFIDGTYNIGTAIFGAPLTATPLTADAILVNDGLGGAGNPYDACESIVNDLTGKIAVIERSGCTPPSSYFVNKAYKAQQAGAVGVIFISNIPGDYVFTMGLPSGPNPTITIPLMLVSKNYGTTLKAEILAGLVNVSLSASTVTANDICSFVAITHQQTFTPGNCPNNYTIVNTWTATDRCGNATTASQTITGVDNTAPTLTVPANITLQCSDPIPLEPLHINSSVNNQPGTYNVGITIPGFGPALTSTPLTADAIMVVDNAGNPYDACETITNNLTGKIAVIERGGCAAPANYFVNKAYKAQQAGAIGVIFISNITGDYVFTMGLPSGPNPTITIPLMLVSKTYGNTLKAAILAGSVNVSLSAPTVIANDVCSFTSITHTSTTTAGSCPSSYTLVNTWTATDQCGNATTASQTIAVVDNTPPTLTVPANVTLQCTDPLPKMPVHINSSPNSLQGTYHFGTAVFGSPLTTTAITGDLILTNPITACTTISNSLTGKIAVIDRGGCTSPGALFTNKVLKAQQAGAVAVIVVNNLLGNDIVNMGGTNPLITIPSIFVSNNYGNAIKASMALGTVNASLSVNPVVTNDNCSSPVLTFNQIITAGSCANNYTIIKSWTSTDVCGNATTASQTITVVDNTAPVVTCKEDQTRLTNNGYCTYTAVGTEFNVLSATDNCTGPVDLTYTLNGATTGSGSNTLNGTLFNTGVTTVSWKATDGCGNFATCSFSVTINDDQNSTGYIIYAKSEAKFGEENDINGDVGVTDANGNAAFKKNTFLDPYFVKAKNITVQLPASVNNRFYVPATGGPNPPFIIYNGTGGAGNLIANVNGTYNGNYKNLTVKKGVTATITGNDFGSIKIEEGANVTFTATVINMQDMIVEKGKKNVNTTNVYFTNPASVKVSNNVTVEEDCMINVNGPKVTFFMGDRNKKEEKFIVAGDNTMVTLNIMIPKGKLKVSGGPRYGIMTGWFIVEKVESDGKKTIWNRYDCFGEPQFTRVSSENIELEIKEKQVDIVTPVAVDVFAVKIYPNPTLGDFNIQVITQSNESIMVRIMDVNGTLVQASTKLTKQGLIGLANKLPGGTYFVEVTQGKNHRVTKLVKLN